MSTPGQPNDPNYNRNPGDGNPYNPGGQPGYPGAPTGPADPYAPGSSGYPPPGGQVPGGPTGYPQQGGYPGQQPGYPAPGGYPAQQGGYPQTGGYPGQQGGYPGQQGGYPGQQGGYPGQQGGYPGVQPYPAGAPGYQGYGAFAGGGLPPQPARPNTVTYAFWCWLAGTAVSLVGLILTLTSPIWDQAVAAAGVQTSGGLTLDVQGLVTTAKVFLVVVFLIFAGVYLLFAFKMHAGRNWARIVLTVFGALTLLSAFTPTSRTVTVNSTVYDVNSGQWANYLTAALALAGIVLMFLAASNRFFAESKAYRQAKQQIRA